jgi:hypothetical protein
LQKIELWCKEPLKGKSLEEEKQYRMVWTGLITVRDQQQSSCSNNVLVLSNVGTSCLAEELLSHLHVGRYVGR